VELAFHESGHAVAAAKLGQKIRKVVLDAGGGFCRVAQPSTTGNRKAIRDFCAVACAGSIAANKLTGKNYWSAGDQADIETKLDEAGSLIEAISILREARALATKIIGENWDSVSTLARELRRRGEMSGVEVTNLLSDFCAAA
jgi:hypothetical protein